MKETINFILTRAPKFYSALLRGQIQPNFEKIVFLNLIKNQDVVIDIGANRGYFTLLFSHLAGPRGEVHAFEPVPLTFEKLSAALRKYKRFDNYRLNPLALSDKTGKTEVHIPGADDGQVSLKIHSAGSWQTADRVTSVECEVTTLDEYSAAHLNKKINFIKSDVEGAELSILKGGVRTITKDQPILYLEIFEQWTKDFGYRPAELVEWLLGRGYEDFYRVDSAIEKLQDPVKDVSEISGPSNLLCLVPSLYADRAKGLIQ